MYRDRQYQAFDNGERERYYIDPAQRYDDDYRGRSRVHGRESRPEADVRGHRDQFDDIGYSRRNDFEENFDGNFNTGRYEAHGYFQDNDYLHPISDERHRNNPNEAMDANRNRRNDTFESERLENDARYYSNHQNTKPDYRNGGEEIEMRHINPDEHLDTRRLGRPSPHRFHDVDAHDIGENERGGPDLEVDRLRNRSEQQGNEYFDFNMPEGHAGYDRSEGRTRPYHSQPDLFHGHRNQGFEMEADYENTHSYRPKVQRGVSLRRRSRKRHRESRREFQSDQRISFADGMKTLIQRRKSHGIRRPMSEIVSGSRMSRAGSVFNGSAYADDDEYDDEDKLPSNRNYKRKTLKYRLQTLQKERPVSSHDMATLLRDQVLSREASLLKGWELRKYQMSMQWQRFTNWFKSWVYQLELWAGAFKVIEGHFGTSTVSYFRFLRWLMFLNLFMTLIMFSIVLLPFLLLDLGKDGSFPASVNACSSIPHNMAVFYSSNYTNDVKIKVHNSTPADQVRDVLQGTGWMENTVLFYGAYHNKTGYLATGDAFTYNMSLAYLCAVGVAFILSFILLVKNSAKGLKQSAVSSVGGNITLYCNKVFGAWDYCISEPKTAQLKHSNLLQDFKNELEYQRLQWKKESRTTKEKFKLYSVRVLINILVIVILGGALYLIYFTNQKLVELEKSDSLSETVALFMQYLPSITIMLLSVIVPTIFNKLVIAEDYMPAFAIRITLIRTVLLRLASLGILMISLYTTLKPEKRDPEVLVPCDNLLTNSDNMTTVSPPENVTMAANENVTSSMAIDDLDTNIMCWETYVGQQIYKLVMLNFIVVLLVTIGWEFPRKFIYEKLHEKLKVVEFVGLQTFDLSKSVLDLVYLQTLCWLGLFFSPIIPAMCFVKCFIFFYVKKGSLLTNCLPMQQYGTSKSNSLFMMVLLLSFFLASIPIIFMIGRIPPSQGCGPFRVHSSQGYIMFDAISNLVDSFAEAKEVFFFMGTGGFMAIVALCLCLLMYYFWMVGQANYKLSKSLREQLKVEGQDKQFLVARLNEAYANDFQ